MHKVRRVQEGAAVGPLRIHVEDHTHGEAEEGHQEVRAGSTGRIHEAEGGRSRDEEAEGRAHRTQPYSVVASE